jgi:chemotaxis protein CheZ
MAAPRKVFRIEELVTAQPDPVAEGAEATLRHAEIMQEMVSLRAALAARASSRPAAPETDARQADEVARLKSELHLIYDAITRTKQELATLHVSSFHGEAKTRAINELDAVMGGTEQATQKILAAAEDIDQSANTLSAAVKSDAEQGLTQDIQDRVIQIFEACNFQDVTGQRITKVAATLKFIEEHVMRMIEIWGGLEAFKSHNPTAALERAMIQLLHGPRLESDDGHASQNDIDVMFG